jgi:hypothetical protein
MPSIAVTLASFLIMKSVTYLEAPWWRGHILSCIQGNSMLPLDVNARTHKDNRAADERIDAIVLYYRISPQ